MILSLGLLLVGSLGARPIEKDARLSLTCSFWERSIDLDSLVRRASGMSGLNLVVDPGIGDLRVILFEEKQPLGQTLARVADCWDLAWARTDGAYRLYRTKEAAEAQKGFLATLKRDADAALDARLDDWRELSATSANESRNRIAQVDQAVRRLQTTVGPPAELASKEADLRSERDDLIRFMGVDRTPVIALVKAMRPADVAKLKSGEWVVGGTCERPGVVRLPGLPADYDYRPNPPAVTQEDAYIGLKYDWIQERLVSWACPGAGGVLGGRDSDLRYANDHRRAIPPNGLTARLSDWVSSENYESLRQCCLADIFVPGHGSLAQCLEKAARATGTPIVGTDVYETDANASGTASWVLSSELPRSGFGEGYWRHADGWLMTRSLDYWRADAISALARLRSDDGPRSSASALGALGDLARLRTAVPDDLRVCMNAEHTTLPIGSRLTWTQDEPAGSCLTFCSLLSRARRRQALGAGLLWRDLNAREKKAAKAIVQELYARSVFVEGAYQVPPVPIEWDSPEIRFHVNAGVSTIFGEHTAQGGTGWTVERPRDPAAPAWIPKDLQDPTEAAANVQAISRWRFDFSFALGGREVKVAFAMSDTLVWEGKAGELAPNAQKLAKLFEPYWAAGAPLAQKRSSH